MAFSKLAWKRPTLGLAVLLCALAPTISTAQTNPGPHPAMPDNSGAVPSGPGKASRSVEAPSSSSRVPDATTSAKMPAAEHVEPAGQPAAETKADIAGQFSSADLEELRENMRDTMELVFRNNRDIDAMQRAGLAAQLADLVRKTQELESRIGALEQRRGPKPGEELPVKPPPPPRVSAAVPPEILPIPAPPQSPEAGLASPWRIEADAGRRPRLISKKEAETWPGTLASMEQCATVGSWIEAQQTRLTKDGFFVRDSSGIGLCRRGPEGDWRVYSGTAATDRFHIVVKSGG